MAKTYFPDPNRIATLDASPPHPAGTKYKISIGYEIWDMNRAVVKIQMEYLGRVEGRKVPSFPLGTDDFQRVTTKAEELISNR